jgi:hypothetical protein
MKHKKAFVLLAAAILVIFMFLQREQVFYALRYVDKNYLNETLKDFRAQLQSDEDWSSLPEAVAYDYRWLEAYDGDEFIRIAHALGGRGDANTFAAYEAATRKGYRLFEVDLWLDENKRIRCHHGPEKPNPLDAESCTLDRLLARLSPGEYLVLDIKTDFFETSRVIIDGLKNTPEIEKIIFQLYLPDHIAQFSLWMETYPLAGPIVTAYSSSRSLNHVYKAVEKSGIKAMSFPIERLPAIKADRKIRLFAHPIANCDDIKKLSLEGVHGAYVKNDLDCD